MRMLIPGRPLRRRHRPGSNDHFVSRGSDKFRAGTTVTTATISGHRDVTYTACPGDIGYGLLAGLAQPGARHPPPAHDPGPVKRAVRRGVHLT